LGELCRRFLHNYGIEGKGVLLLDSCTKELGVERRRIYDIINILESFFVIRRRAKNEYQWRGIDKIATSIEAQIEQGKLQAHLEGANKINAVQSGIELGDQSKSHSILRPTFENAAGLNLQEPSLNSNL